MPSNNSLFINVVVLVCVTLDDKLILLTGSSVCITKSMPRPKLRMPYTKQRLWGACYVLSLRVVTSPAGARDEKAVTDCGSSSRWVELWVPIYLDLPNSIW